MLTPYFHKHEQYLQEVATFGVGHYILDPFGPAGPVSYQSISLKGRGHQQREDGDAGSGAVQQ